MSFDLIFQFEKQLSKFTGAPYVVTTDCCTHAIELCLLYDKIKACSFTAFTYISVLQTMHKLNIDYTLQDLSWMGEYKFDGTRIWDSARRLQPNMYRTGQLQCLSFGYSKPVDIGRGGAILCDNYEDYRILSMMRYDGRDLSISPWQQQETFSVGYHYKLNPEECARGIDKLLEYMACGDYVIKKVKYPDCRKVVII